MFSRDKMKHTLCILRYRRLFSQLPIVMMAAALSLQVACSSGNSSNKGSPVNSNPNPTATILTGITFEFESYTLEVDEVKILNIYATYSDNSQVLLSSNEPGLSLQLNENGYISLNNTSNSWEITGHLGMGTTTITASYDGFSASSTVQVLTHIVSIDISPPDRYIPIDFYEIYTANANYNDGRVEDVTALASWRVADDTLAAFSNDPNSVGVLLTRNFGTTEVMAQVGDIVGNTTVTIPEAIPFGRSYPIYHPGSFQPTIVEYGLPILKLNELGNVGVIQQKSSSIYEMAFMYYDKMDGWGTTTVVSGDVGYNPGAPLLSMNDVGDMAGAWSSADGIHSAYKPQGVDTSSAVLVTGSDDPDDSVLINNMIGLEHIGLLWTKDNVMDGNVRYSVFDTSSNTWGDPVSVLPSYAVPKDVSINRDGDIVLLAGINSDPTTLDYDLVGIYFDANTKQWSSYSFLMRLNIYSNKVVAIALNNNGVAVGLATSDQDVGSNDLVNYIYFTPGNGWSTESEVVTSMDIIRAKIGINDSGYATAVWNENAGTYPVVATQYSPLTGWGSEHTLAEGVRGNLHFYSPIYLNSGEIIYSWEKPHGPLGYDHSIVAAQHYTPDNGWGDVKSIYELGMIGNPGGIYYDKNKNDEIVISWPECCEYVPDPVLGGWFLSQHEYVHLYYNF
jgi:hypothetical protein